MTNRSVTVAEWRWVIAFASVVMLITGLPYVIAFGAQGSEWVFSGFLFGIEDGNSYIAKMLDGYHGDWLFRTPYSTAPQDGAVVFLPYLLLGKLAYASNLHLSLILIFHTFRIVAGIASFFATYGFIALFTSSAKSRKFALVIIMLGGGLGWLLVILGKGQWLGTLPLEFYSPESFGFLSTFGIPHLAMARALLLFGLTAYLLRHGVMAGGLWLALGFFQPVAVAVAWAVVGAHIASLWIYNVWSSRQNLLPKWDEWRTYLRQAILAGLISAPIVIYSTFIFWVDPFLQAWKWSGQNLITSPHPLHYLLAYGLLLPFAFIGARWVIVRRDRKGFLPIAWLLIFPLLVYAPVDFQRRLAEGVWVAIVILTVIAIDNIRSKKRLLFSGLTALTLPSTLFLLIGGYISARQLAPPTFFPVDKTAAFEYISDVAHKDAVVLTSFDTGNSLPAWAPVRVVIGHGPESVGLAELQPRVASFYQSSTDDQTRKDIIVEFEVRYIFWGPDERALGDWQPSNEPYITLIFERGDYAIYEVFNEE